MPEAPPVIDGDMIGDMAGWVTEVPSDEMELCGSTIELCRWDVRTMHETAWEVFSPNPPANAGRIALSALG